MSVFGGVWVDAGNDFNPALKAKGINAPFFDVRDKYATLAHLTGLRNSGVDPGLFLCSQGDGWPSHTTMAPEAWVDEFAYPIVQKQIAPGTSGSFPMVDLNCETNANWVMRMLRRWRLHSPNRTTAFVVAANQWPLFAAYAAELTKLKIIIRPECFVDPGMRRVESASEVSGWTRIGIDPLKVQPMIDGAAMGEWWNGSAGASIFTQGRVPV